MKKTLRFLSCLLIVAMLMTMMTVPAFAATPDGEIKLLAPGTETIAGKTFDLYRIFNATVATGSDAIAYQWVEKTDDQGDPTGEYYFYDFFFGNEIKVTENEVEKKIAPLIETKANADIAEVVSWIENANTGNAWVAEFGQKLYDYIEYVEKTDADAFDAVRKSKTAGAADTSVVYNGLDYGYYLVYETTTVTTENDENLVRSAILLTNVETKVEATLKIARTSIIKQAKRDAISYEGLSASVGEKLSFYIEATIPNFEYYEITPTFNIVDIPAAGFTMPDDAGFIVKCGSDVQEMGADKDYTIDRSTPGQIKFIFDYDKCIKNYPNQKATIEYQATLNSNASVGGYDNTDPDHPVDDADINLAEVHFSADPYDASDINIIQDKARVYSFRLNIFKQSAQGHSPLAGAQFKLQNSATHQWAVVGSDGMINSWDTEENASLLTTVLDTASGKAVVTVEGLGRGSFALKEVTPPDGYNKPIEPFLFVIGGATDKTTGVLTELNISGTNAALSGFEGSVKTGTVSMTVDNATGAELPETGGMGTTLFTIGGLILMAGAAALLMARKKTEN